MSDSSEPESSEKKEDLTGKDRMISNVLTGWVAYVIFLIAGFIMPRLIDNYEGQFALGIWDFSWTFINYLSMSGLGLAAALNRFVPRYRTTGELDKLGETVSTVVMLQILIAIFVISVTALLYFIVPVYFSDRLGDQTEVASLVVFFLGAGLAVEMLFDSSRGVIAGYHRWDIVNGINSLSRIASTIGMIAALLMGGGLISLSVVYFAVTCIFMLARYFVSRKLCTDINVAFSSASMATAKEMLVFGLKTVAVVMPRIILLQTINVIIAASLGPAALAVFTRPVVLVKYVGTFISRFSFVLTPTAGALQASGDDKGIRDFILETTRISVSITLPLLIVIAAYGDVIIGIWMGDDYINQPLIILLAIGTFLQASQQTTVRILIGMNMHGRLGLISFVIILLVFIPGYIYFSETGWSLINAAVLFVLSEILGAGIVIPIYACRLVKIPIYQYLKRAFVTPVLICCVFLGVILLNRVMFEDSRLLALLGGLLSGGLILSLLYWKLLLTTDQRGKLSGYMKKFSPAR